MHILFVHQNFPAQFGHIAHFLAEKYQYRCTFVSEKPGGQVGHTERIQYRVKGGATNQTHYCSRTFENYTWHAHAVFEALQGRPDIQPDLIVGHAGFGPTLFLRELYDAPIINYFEYYYRTVNSDMDFRPDFPGLEIDRLRARSRNAMLLLDLENCNAGYSPTVWQKSCFPKQYHDKIETIFDGIDTNIWSHKTGDHPRLVGQWKFERDTKIVTYATRGMESMRGFDLFMRFANRLAKERSDVAFVIAGQDRVCYGGDQRFTNGKTFKEWVLSQEDYDLSRFIFTGLLPPQDLARLFHISNLHVYWTVPFVLSWSLMNAMSCSATIMASNTAPLQEMITHERNGLLVDFFDLDKMVETALKVLGNPGEYEHLGRNAAADIAEKYSLDVCLPKMRRLYEQTVQSFVA